MSRQSFPEPGPPQCDRSGGPRLGVQSVWTATRSAVDGDSSPSGARSSDSWRRGTRSQPRTVTGAPVTAASAATSSSQTSSAGSGAQRVNGDTAWPASSGPLLSRGAGRRASSGPLPSRGAGRGA
jgi:hypothetical protein